MPMKALPIDHESTRPSMEVTSHWEEAAMKQVVIKSNSTATHGVRFVGSSSCSSSSLNTSTCV